MRYCFSCRRITSGKPYYCNYCGRSYGVKRCPRGHANPRGAEVCSECGSRNLSMPHSRGRISLWVLMLFGFILPFVTLLTITLGYMYVFLQAMIQNSSGLLPLMLMGLGLGLLWLFWVLVSSTLRRLLYGSDPDGKRK